MDDEMLKLKCLELATQQGMKGDLARDEADRMFAQIKGRSDPHNPNAKARVVGVDGKLEKPFDDYVKE